MEIKTKWLYPRASKEVSEAVRKLSVETGLSTSLVTIFYNRNIRTKEEIQNFLNFTMGDVPSPKLLKDMEKVAER